MTRLPVDDHDVQRLVRSGHGRLKEATYALVRVKSLEDARAWLRAAPVTTAADPPPQTALQVAFTAEGLEALGVPLSVLAGFSAEFLTGMTECSRSRRLGDIRASDPAGWTWGRHGETPHMVAMFFAETGRLGPFMAEATGQAWTKGFEVLRLLPTGNLSGVEPFGFADGISQPQLDWDQERAVSAGRHDYSNVSALGEFLLGYRNEYDKYTERPLLDSEAATAGLLAAEDAPDKRDLGRNGTYLVMRQLRQDVRGFWQFVTKETGGDRAAAEQLAAAFVGRQRDGQPLVPMQATPIPGIGTKEDQIRLNQFTYDGDAAGSRCPFGAHVRRANPRNTDYPGRPTGLRRILANLGFSGKAFRDDLVSSVRFHRILRRGRGYGPGLAPEDALAPAPADDPERGLHFLCLNASIGRQFEFLQNAWMMSTKFSGLTGESDPLIGNRQAIAGCPAFAEFVLPRDGGVAHRVDDVPQFTTVRGGAYFFLPSLRALRFFAGATACASELRNT